MNIPLEDKRLERRRTTSHLSSSDARRFGGRCGFVVGSPWVPGIDQHIHISVDRYNRFGLAVDRLWVRRASLGFINISTFWWREQSIHTEVSTTGLVLKTLKSNGEKNTSKSSHLTSEDRWIDRPELPGAFGTLSRNSRSNVDR